MKVHLEERLGQIQTVLQMVLQIFAQNTSMMDEGSIEKYNYHLINIHTFYTSVFLYF